MRWRVVHPSSTDTKAPALKRPFLTSTYVPRHVAIHLYPLLYSL